MESTDDLISDLSQFTGTENYYRITPRHILTDGTKYLAEKGRAFWLLSAIASHLPKNFNDYFCVANLNVNNTGAVLTIDDGNGKLYAKQTIEYTDFPLNEIKLYCSFDGAYWIIMLTSEY